MSLMKNILSKAGVGALVVGVALAVSPMKANAVTMLDRTNSGDTFDVLLDAYQFQDAWVGTDSAATLSFIFENTSADDANVVLSSATINQLGGGVFTEGASVFWTNAGTVTTAAEGATNSGQLSFILGAGMSDTLNVSFGDPVTGERTNYPEIDFFVTATAVPIPIPAAGLMLLTALGGLGLARRRRKAA